MLRRVLLVAAVLVAAVYMFNASWRAGAPEGDLLLIAHRGVHQAFDNNGLGNDGCSAERIYPPTHGYLENTLPSMRAAFAAGADIVELDVHPTTDGQFAVMHDWTLDCHTEGRGEVRAHELAYLKTLDIGYGYTPDGGGSYPFRGKGVGMMPELKEVLAAFPEGRFLVNFKSREQREGDMLGALIGEHPEWRRAIWGAYGGDAPTFRAAELIGGIATWSRKSMVDCLLQYELVGWTGTVPEPCRNTTIMLPLNFAPFIWGWPNLFLERLQAAGTEVILMGPYEAGDSGTSGIDTAEELAQVPEGFTGYLWTNRIELIGPLARQRFPLRPNN